MVKFQNMSKEILLIIGRGIGQVMFQNNAFSGLLMLIGIVCNSLLLAFLALAGNVVSTLMALLAGYSKDDIRNGLYGFNGTLVGIAIGVFMKINFISIFLLILASCFSTWVTNLFSRQEKLPGFTAPFIITIWLLLISCHYLCPFLFLSSVSGVIEQSADLFRAFSLNMGQVMLQGNSVLTGLFFLIGIFINSRINAIYAILGAVIPLMMVLWCKDDYSAFNTGMLGYNGVLCCIAIGDRSKTGIVFATLSVFLSIILQVIGMNLDVTTLTAPFVLSVWIVLGIRYITLKKYCDLENACD